MFKDKNFKYKVYTDGYNKTVAVAKFAGKVVKATVRVREGDVYDAAKGQEIAIAACAKKIAEKRVANAEKQVAEAEAAYNAAKKVLAGKYDYLEAANQDLTDKATDFAKYFD